MSIDNKWELLAALSESELQGFSAEGDPMTFSIFESLEYHRAREINRHVEVKLREYLQSQGSHFEITPTGYIHMLLEGFDLNNADEVGQFLYHAGYLFGLLEAAVKNQEGGDNP